MRDAAGRSRCFAFLTFEDPQSVNAVMVREHFLDGKIVRPRVGNVSRCQKMTYLICYTRLIPSVQFLGKNTKGLQNCS